MGMGPVAAVLGVAQGVSSMAQGSQQRRIAEAQAAANQKAAEASAALRQIQINTSRDYADYNANLNSLTRQFQSMQASMGSQAQGILDTMNYQGQMGQLGMADVANQMGLVGANAEADRMVTGAKQNELAQRTQASAESTGNQNQLANAAQGTAQGIKQGDARRAMLTTMMAASGGVPGQTEMALQTSDLNNEVAQVLAQSLQQEGISESDLKQLLYSRDIADIAKQLGVSQAEYMRAAAQRQADMASTTIGGKRTDLGIENAMAAAGRDTSMKMMNFAMSSDANADQINRIFAESGFQQQANASNIQLQSQLAGINASRASAQASSPGLFDYLGMGLKAYSSLSGSGLFGGGSSATGNASGNPFSSGSYSIFTGGYGVTPYQNTNGFADPTNYGTSGASFTQLPL